MLYRVNEIFDSVQGEGFWTGAPAIFIRFAGCSVKNCLIRNQCDTYYDPYIELTPFRILRRVESSPGRIKRVVLTGGEPTDQNIEQLVDLLHQCRYAVHIETSGIREVPKNIDWITVSPKMSPEMLVQKRGHELKLVYVGQKKEILNQFIETTEFDYYYLQPEWNRKNFYETYRYCIKNPQWRLSLQVHKLIGVQ